MAPASRKALLVAFICLCLLLVGMPATASELPAGYPLGHAPLPAYRDLAKLKLGEPTPISPADQKLLERIWAFRLRGAIERKQEEAVLLDTLLLASGVSEPKALARYRQQWDKIMAEATKAVKGAKDECETGERLMTHLHKHVLHKGYESKQSSFAETLDSGRFNCVSSTAVYYLAGSRLGLELRPISIAGSSFQSGHAALDLVRGSERLQVEPTNPDGFDWGAKLKKPGVIVLGFQPDRSKGQETDGLGIAAMICANRTEASSHKEDFKPMEAASYGLMALAINPKDETAAQNLLATFGNWGKTLVESKQPDEALRVLAMGVELYPKEAALRNNYRIAFSDSITALLEANQEKAALARMAEAAHALPEEKDLACYSSWFIRQGQHHAKSEGWEAGNACAERGIKLLTKEEGAKLRAWRTSQYRQWSQELLDKKDAAGSLRVLQRAYADDPQNSDVVAGIAYHMQEALPLVESSAGVAKMLEHYQALRQQFPKVDSVTRSGADHACRALDRLTQQEKFTEALTKMKQYQPLLADPKLNEEAGEVVYDGWAGSLVKKQDWKAALARYAEGLKAHPKSQRLRNNLQAITDEWASAAINAKRWDEAIGIYAKGLEIVPDSSHLKHNKTYCEEMKAKGGS